MTINPNLLIISTAMAKHLKTQWNTSESISLVILGICAIITIILFANYGSSKSMSSKLPTISFYSALVITIGIAFISYNNDVAQHLNVGAIDNVGCYHQLKHLKAIYPKLPCHPNTKKICQSNSISHASSANYKAKHTFTRHEAVQKYNHIKSYYRHLNSDQRIHGNGTRSLHPTAPKWYNYV